MTRRFTRLAWTAATFTYLLIVLGGVVRITGSGLGCGEHWPLCNGRLFPPLDLRTLIEYAHRLVAAAVLGLVVALTVYAWRLRCALPAGSGVKSRSTTATEGAGSSAVPSALAYGALALLIGQILLGAVTVRLRLPPWTVVLHLAVAMVLLATLIRIAQDPGGEQMSLPQGIALGGLALGFTTLLAGALTANTGAASACLGFPLCNAQVLPRGNVLQSIHWTHRLLAYGLFGYVLWWGGRTRRRAVWGVAVLVSGQVVVAAAMVLLRLPPALAAAHVAFGAAVWGGLVVAAW